MEKARPSPRGWEDIRVDPLTAAPHERLLSKGPAPLGAGREVGGGPAGPPLGHLGTGPAQPLPSAWPVSGHLSPPVSALPTAVASSPRTFPGLAFPAGRRELLGLCSCSEPARTGPGPHGGGGGAWLLKWPPLPYPEPLESCVQGALWPAGQTAENGRSGLESPPATYPPHEFGEVISPP